MFKPLKLFILAILITSLSSCSLILTPKPATGGGVFKSYDRGVTWEDKSTISTSDTDKKKKKTNPSLARTNTLVLNADHRNSRILYLGTDNHGLFKSDNGGDSWLQIIQSGRVGGVAIDPYVQSTIYAALNNQVAKSTNNGYNWRILYTEGRAGAHISTLAIDPYDSKILYAGTSAGEILKSEDYGVNWRVLSSFGSYVAKILINVSDTNIIYTATSSRGVFRSSDKGETWTNLLDTLWVDRKATRAYKGAEIYHDMAADLSQPDLMLLVTDYGLFKINGQDRIWNQINLVTPPREKKIYSIVIDPKNSNNIYYGTSTAFYRSEDGGQSWSSIKLPSGRASVALLIDENTPNIIYSATAAVKEKKPRQKSNYPRTY